MSDFLELDVKVITSSADTEVEPVVLVSGLLLATGAEVPVGVRVLLGLLLGVREVPTHRLFTHCSPASHKLGQEPPHPLLPHCLPAQLGTQQISSLTDVNESRSEEHTSELQSQS